MARRSPAAIPLFLALLVALSAHAAAFSDFDGDTRSDIFWRNSATGENYLYPMDATTIRPAEGYLRTVPQSDWQIQNPTR